jgi:hypothetical protein
MCPLTHFAEMNTRKNTNEDRLIQHWVPNTVTGRMKRLSKHNDPYCNIIDTYPQMTTMKYEATANSKIKSFVWQEFLCYMRAKPASTGPPVNSCLQLLCLKRLGYPHTLQPPYHQYGHIIVSYLVVRYTTDVIPWVIYSTITVYGITYN